MLSYFNEVDQMVVLVMRTDGLEELSEWSMLPGGELPVGHIESGLGHLLEEGILGQVILPVDAVLAGIHLHIRRPGGEDMVVLLDVVDLGHLEDILLGIGVEGTGESDIVHCRFRCLVDFLDEGVDRSVDVSPDVTGVIVSFRDVDGLHHLTGLLRDEGEIWSATFLGMVIYYYYVHTLQSIPDSDEVSFTSDGEDVMLLGIEVLVVWNPLELCEAVDDARRPYIEV